MNKSYIDLINTNFTSEGFLYPAGILEPSIVKYLGNRKYNPEPKGLQTARSTIAKRLYVESAKDKIFITSSTSESYSLIFNNFSKPGDEILFPTPTYPLFEYLSDFSHLTPKYYKLDQEKNWKVDINSIETILQSDKLKKVKGIVLITPNNPTGSILEKIEFDKIISLAKKYGLFIVVDNVFDIFNFSDIDQINYKDLQSNEVKVFWLNGISKMFGLPDLKLAWCFCQNCNETDIEKLEIYNDTYLNANYLTQSILPELFENSNIYQSNIIEKVKNNFELFYNTLDDEIFEFNKSIGGIHTIITLKNKFSDLENDQTMQEKLLKSENVNLHPASFYSLKSEKVSFVVSMLNAREYIIEGANRLNNFFRI